MIQQHHVLRLNHLVFLGIKILNYENKPVSIKDWTNSIQKEIYIRFLRTINRRAKCLKIFYESKMYSDRRAGSRMVAAGNRRGRGKRNGTRGAAHRGLEFQLGHEE